MKTIYLPTETDSEISLNYGGDEPLNCDVFELNDLFVKAQTMADESGKKWKDEFAPLFRSKYGVTLVSGQILLLWDAVSEVIEDLKKKLFQGSSPSTKLESSEQSQNLT